MASQSKQIRPITNTNRQNNGLFDHKYLKTKILRTRSLESDRPIAGPSLMLWGYSGRLSADDLFRY